MSTSQTTTPPESLGSPLGSVPDDVPFPTSEEAREILAREGIDITGLHARFKRKLCEIKGHDWKLSWPLDPCEYTCERCGEKVLH